MKIKVNVTQEHIDDGVRYDAGFCPIALAIHAVEPGFPNQESFTVGYRYMGNNHMLILMPRSAQQFSEAFDLKKDVKPFSFSFKLIS